MLRPLATALALIAAPSASAVIVAGANGGGSTNNTDAASLDTAVAGSFGLFDNVVGYSNASGIYLGHNGSDVWVISAKHVDDNNSDLTIDGLAYQHQARHLLPDSDIELNRYSRGDFQVPSLPSVPLAMATPTLDTPVVMIGFGRERTEAATVDADTSDATSVGAGLTGYHWHGSDRVKRWGTNNISLSPATDDWAGGNLTETDPSFGTIVFTDFDEPGSGEWLSSNEAHLAIGDSGGGLFFQDGGTWTLAGINSLIFAETGQAGSTSGFTNHTGSIDIATYRSAILAETGSLVPEPSVCALLVPAAAFLLRRRRTRR